MIPWQEREDYNDDFDAILGDPFEEDFYQLGKQRVFYGKSPNIDCNRAQGQELLHQDYFCMFPTYTAAYIQRWFCMSHDLFLKIRDAVESQDSFFVL